MTNTIKYSGLSLVAALCLSACGGSSNSASSNEVQKEQSAYIQREGLSGVVLADTYVKGAKVCFDLDSDGSCDTNEPYEKTYEGGKFSFSKQQTDASKDAKLLVEVNNSYILMANQKTSKQVISPFTTLVVNEQYYNPYTNANESQAVADLINSSPKAIFNKSNLEAYDYLQGNQASVNIEANTLVNSFKKAYALDKTKPLETLATTVDEIIKNDNLDVNVTSLVAQKRADIKYSLKEDISFSIPTQDNNQRSVSLSVNANDTIIQSKWNNKLTILKTNESSIKESKNYIHGLRGDNTSSGATEKSIVKSILSTNSSSLYSIIPTTSKSKNNSGLGLYFSSFSGSTPSLAYASLSEGTNYYSHNNFTDLVLDENNSKVFASSSENKIFVFSSNNLNTAQVINTNAGVNKLELSNDKTKLYSGVGNSFEIYSTSTNTLLGSKDLASNINAILDLGNNKVAVSFSNNHRIFILDLTNPSSIQISKDIVIGEYVKEFALSSDKKSLLVAFKDSKQLKVYLIDSYLNSDNSDDLSVSLTLEANINDISFTKDNKALAISDFKAFYINLEGEGKELSAADKTTWRNTHRK